MGTVPSGEAAVDGEVSGGHEFTAEDADALCALWQKRLRLQDWKVSVRILPHWKIKPGTEGCCDQSILRKVALIDIVDPGHLFPSEHWPNDMEQTLVHELLHLHFAPFEAEAGSPADIAQEQAIDMIADALVALARGSA